MVLARKCSYEKYFRYQVYYYLSSNGGSPWTLEVEHNKAESAERASKGEAEIHLEYAEVNNGMVAKCQDSLGPVLWPSNCTLYIGLPSS